MQVTEKTFSLPMRVPFILKLFPLLFWLRLSQINSNSVYSMILLRFSLINPLVFMVWALTLYWVLYQTLWVEQCLKRQAPCPKVVRKREAKQNCNVTYSFYLSLSEVFSHILYVYILFTFYLWIKTSTFSSLHYFY